MKTFSQENRDKIKTPTASKRCYKNATFTTHHFYTLLSTFIFESRQTKSRAYFTRNFRG